jgi:capsule polysaccharide export protein KpsE/RkpR
MLEMQVKAAGELKDQIAAERDDLRAERDHWRRQATALLTSQQEAKVTAPPRPWWHRFF